MTWVISNVGLLQLGVAVFVASSALTFAMILGKPRAGLIAALMILVGLSTTMALVAWLNPSMPIRILAAILLLAFALYWQHRAGGIRQMLVGLTGGRGPASHRW